jgi:hypothetical protein
MEAGTFSPVKEIKELRKDVLRYIEQVTMKLTSSSGKALFPDGNYVAAGSHSPLHNSLVHQIIGSTKPPTIKAVGSHNLLDIIYN